MRAHVAAVSLSLLIVGCSEESTSPPPPSGYKDDLHFETGEFSVPPGDSFECFYTSTKTDHIINVTGAFATQKAGGHHVTVYYTNITRDPQHHPCDDAEMVTWNMIAGAAGNGEPTLSLPEGTALRVPADVQLVVQAHYINTTGKDQTVNDAITVRTAPDEDIKEYANFWAMADTGFSLAPNGAGESVSVCTTTQDINTLVLLGHMHELGKHYKLEEIDAQGNVVSTIYDHDWSPEFASHPPIIFSTLEAPLTIKAGTKLRQTCTWNNSTAEMVQFPREMCVAFSVYFPDQGSLYCDPVPAP